MQLMLKYFSNLKITVLLPSNSFKMKTKITLLVLFSTLSLIAQQGAPATYYNGFNWSQTATSLKNALSTKITSLTQTH